jgi:hypothetical protein
MIEVLKKYPKAAEVLRQYYFDKFMEALKESDIPDDYKEYLKKEGVDDQKVAEAYESAPRMLFDVFDKYAIYIYVGVTIYPEQQTTFFYQIIYADVAETEMHTFHTRIEADREAVTEALSILEQQLTENVTESH